MMKRMAVPLALALVCACPAQSHLIDGQEVSKWTGMIKLSASAAVATPANGATVTAGELTVESDGNHYVTIEAPGGTVNVDYQFTLGLNGQQMGNGIGANSCQADVSDGFWSVLAEWQDEPMERTGQVAAGSAVADATAWIQLAGNSATRAASYHGHSITAQ
jgi:hypothetical protein